MAVDEEPPDWYDDPTIIDDDYDVDTAERDAERYLYELSHLTGQPIPTNGQTAAQTLRHEVGNARLTRLHEHGYGDLDDLLNEPDPDYDWLIPGLLERHDRVVLTGQEGKGKSTLLRQIAVQVAAGIHPFTLEPITPVRVAIVDLENSRDHDRRQFRILRLSAGTSLLRGFLAPIIWPAGIDLLQATDRKLLNDLLTAAGVDLLIIGPSYKMAAGDPTSEETARAVTRTLDELRDRYGFALILEAHQPYATPGTRRVERPYGASLWSRWPEFGLHLGDSGPGMPAALRHWRGARDERDWPAALQRGGTWPWTVVTDARGVTFARILDEIRDAGYELSRRDLAERLGGHHSTITRAIDANRKQYNQVVASLKDDAE